MARKPKKTNIIKNYIDGHSNQIVTVQKLAELADCTVQNVYVFMRNNPARFEQISRGSYKILPSFVEVDPNVHTNAIELD